MHTGGSALKVKVVSDDLMETRKIIAKVLDDHSGKSMEFIWDGTDVHVVLFDSDYEYKLPETPVSIGAELSENDESANLETAATESFGEPSVMYSK